MRISTPGPPGRADAAPWRRWLLPAAVAAGFVALLARPRDAAPGQALSYTGFLADVGAGTDRLRHPHSYLLTALIDGT